MSKRHLWKTVWWCPLMIEREGFIRTGAFSYQIGGVRVWRWAYSEDLNRLFQ